jgi:type VI secretion system protein ImpF
MARAKSEILVTQSLLDRLTDYDEWPTTRNSSLSMYREGIKRDVEWLLNSRRPNVPGMEDYPLAANSVFNFGLPDITQFSFKNVDPNALAMSILHTMRTHEPRILQPRVELSRSDKLNRNLRFHVEGILVLEDGKEEISFDTLLQLTSGEYEVR